jgi:S1-C subfamily serine protease
MRAAFPDRIARFARIAAIVGCFAALGAAFLPLYAAPPGHVVDKNGKPQEHVATVEPANSDKIDADQLFGAIVKISTRTVPNARSAETLGIEREGTGIVIDNSDLVLTIGYLVLEAEDVQITDAKGRVLPAQVVGYDHASGFALVRSIVPLGVKPIPLGDSGKTSERDPVLIASAGGDGAAFAWIVSKRSFSGSWEYELDYALYTSPPTLNWSGAALIDRDGKLVGVGSLIVRQATEGEPTLPGNVFVPIDFLKPILADLVKQGHRAGPARPWLGLAAEEVQGRVFVVRVSPDGPADKAGISAGDIILGVGDDNVHTRSELYSKLWSQRAAGDEIPLKVLQGADIRNLSVHSIDRLDYYRSKATI